MQKGLKEDLKLSVDFVTVASPEATLGQEHRRLLGAVMKRNA
ncbi:MAG: hypothetical protein AB1705_07305 [Verrucomicrobiota bacterium]